MKVSVEISARYKEPIAVIYTDQVTDEIRRMMDVLGSTDTPITATENETDLVILQPKEVYMVRVENGDTILYGEKKQYRSRVINRFLEVCAEMNGDKITKFRAEEAETQPTE